MRSRLQTSLGGGEERADGVRDLSLEMWREDRGTGGMDDGKLFAAVRTRAERVDEGKRVYRLIPREVELAGVYRVGLADEHVNAGLVVSFLAILDVHGDGGAHAEVAATGLHVACHFPACHRAASANSEAPKRGEQGTPRPHILAATLRGHLPSVLSHLGWRFEPRGESHTGSPQRTLSLPASHDPRRSTHVHPADSPLLSLHAVTVDPHRVSLSSRTHHGRACHTCGGLREGEDRHHCGSLRGLVDCGFTCSAAHTLTDLRRTSWDFYLRR